ncbi:MAG TPA: AMP-binding protein [Quisquiliibacterium sp.]|nr:AMP-binding protein [Quisquiliibacterium sp.]
MKDSAPPTTAPAARLFGELPHAAALQWPDATAVTFEGAHLTFAEIDAAVDRAARALLARGVGKGDCVGLWITNRPEFIVAYYAVEKVGAIAVPFNTRYRQDDLAFVLRHAECRMMITVDRSGPIEYERILRAVVPEFEGDRFEGSAQFPHLKDIVVVSSNDTGGARSWSRFLAEGERVAPEALAQAAARVQPDDIALIVFTSGTTGNPKGVMHDHSCLRNVRERTAQWPIGAGDTVLNFLPMFHLYGLSEMVLACMVTGARQVVMDAFDPDEAVRLIAQERVNGLHGFETHYADLMRSCDRLGLDVSSLRFGTLPAGMQNSNAVAHEVQDRLCPTVSGLGMSETWAWVCICTLDDTRAQRCETSGRPMAGVEIRIVDPETGAAVPPGVPGEILYRGYTVMRGYFRDPEATARTIDAEGWLHSGDQGLVRADGFVQFLGRYKEMLKVGGENVSPAAVEQELQKLVPAIEQVAVVGLADARLAEVPVAYVVPRAGMTCTVDEVLERCKGRIASFKIPRHVVVVDSLPMTASGKVQRVLLQARARKELGGH